MRKINEEYKGQRKSLEEGDDYLATIHEQPSSHDESKKFNAISNDE